MYELVNTSVPNGLIAGTHGFSTVAMTKGMPDAIRTRVENFCAYPHRTSAHDATYFAENPVNWFHLTLPNGDHVLGRTAPADFDYTGRTNRLSRTLVFGSREMPDAGGASVLSAAAQMLSEPWSGDPKYLADNKALAEQLRFLDRPKTPSPSNWIALFGANGDDLAQRFAALVAKNVSAGGRSVYFKLSAAADASGTRVLGLYADLIDLLPDDVASCVTFSTFSPCVPSGVTCHLRGVFDSDRAFEVASATQPWVDCEHGRVVHAELLPEPLAPAVAKLKAGLKVENAAEDKISSQPRFLPGNQRRSASASAAQASRYAAQAASNTDTFLWKSIAGFTVAVSALIAVAIWYVMSQRQATEDVDLDLMLALDTPSQSDVQSTANSVATNVTNVSSAQAYSPQKPKDVNSVSAGEKVGVRDSGQSEKERLATEIEADKQAKKIEDEKAKSAKRQQEEAERVRRILERPLSELTGAEVIPQGKRLVDELEKLDESIKMSLTNENRLVAYFLRDKQVSSVSCRFEYKSPRKGPGQKQASWTLRCDDPLGGMLKNRGNEDCTPWVVWRVVDEDPAKERVYWEWMVLDWEFRLFKSRETVSVWNLVVGENDGAAKVWHGCQPKRACIRVANDSGVVYVSNGDVTLDMFLLPQIESLQNRKVELEADIKNVVTLKNQYDAKFSNLKSAKQKLDTAIYVDKPGLEKIKDKDKNKEKAQKEKRKGEINSAIKEIVVNEACLVSEKEFQAVKYKNYEIMLNDRIKKMKDEGPPSGADLQKELRAVEKAMESCRRKLKDSNYVLTVEIEGLLPNAKTPSLTRSS